MIVVIARYSLAEGKREEYLKAVNAENIIEKCRAEAGNVSYEFLCSPENKEEIVVLERWENHEILDRHGKEPHFLRMLEIKKSFGASPSVVDKYEVK